MPLTDVAIRNAKPKDKPFKLSDGGGLFLWVQPGGGKWWRYKYRFAGKEKLLAIGSYPDVSLADARERHASARKALAAGVDPSEAKKEGKRLLVLNAENTFEKVAREWYEKRKHKWVTGYAAAMMRRLERHVLPKLGKRPVKAISAPELLSVLRVIEESDALDMARRMLQTCGQIFSFAVATGRAERNPVPDLRGALKTPNYGHHAYGAVYNKPEFEPLVSHMPSPATLRPTMAQLADNSFPTKNESDLLIKFHDEIIPCKEAFRHDEFTFYRAPLSYINQAKKTDAYPAVFHQSMANVVFCDGHVESPTLQFLFADTSAAALSRWNRDHQPHREKLSP